VGHGADIAKYVISSFIDQAWEFKDIFLIATHALEQTKKTDMYCGGNSEFGVLFKDGVTNTYNGFDISKSEAFSKTFEQAMKDLFFASADLDLTDDRVKAALHLLELNVTSIREEQKAKKEERERIMKLLTRNSILALGS